MISLLSPSQSVLFFESANMVALYKLHLFNQWWVLIGGLLNLCTLKLMDAWLFLCACTHSGLLLTPGGTAANTPAGYENRKLGGSSSQVTPATTPTEGDTLLHQNSHPSPPLPSSNPTGCYANINAKSTCHVVMDEKMGRERSVPMTGTSSPPSYPPPMLFPSTPAHSHGDPNAMLHLTPQVSCYEALAYSVTYYNNVVTVRIYTTLPAQINGGPRKMLKAIFFFGW